MGFDTEAFRVGKRVEYEAGCTLSGHMCIEEMPMDMIPRCQPSWTAYGLVKLTFRSSVVRRSEQSVRLSGVHGKVPFLLLTSRNARTHQH